MKTKYSVLLYLLFVCISATYAQTDFSGVDKVLNKYRFQLGGNVSALILKDNHIVHSYNLGTYTETTPELIASCSKWFTAALVMTFVEEGKLSLNDPVCKYLPEFRGNGRENILIKHCLSHTTGIQSEKITLKELAQRRKYKTLAEEVNAFAQLPMVGEPGKVFAYGQKGLNIAGRILEVISGSDFETLFQQRLAKPLGMVNTTFTGKQAVNPSGGATSTATDYMHFLQMILNEGNYNGKQILKPETIAMMQQNVTQNIPILYAPEQAEGVNYGYGEWIHRTDANNRGTLVSSPGLFGTFPYINRDKGYAAIIFAKNWKVKDRKAMYNEIIKTVDGCF